jgi:hypothetical protein
VKFLVMVEGSGFQLTIDGRLQRIGFYASRVVDGSQNGQFDSDRLLDTLYSELDKSEVVRTGTSQISINEVKLLQTGMSAVGSGFTFYSEDN